MGEEPQIQYERCVPGLQSAVEELRVILKRTSKHGYGGQDCAVAPALHGAIQDIQEIGRDDKKLPIVQDWLHYRGDTRLSKGADG